MLFIELVFQWNLSNVSQDLQLTSRLHRLFVGSCSLEVVNREYLSLFEKK